MTRLLLENGIDRILLQDGTSLLLMEDAGGGSITATVNATDANDSLEALATIPVTGISVSDSFDGADGSLGPNWTQVSGTWARASNVATQTSAGDAYYHALYTGTPPTEDDYSVSAQVRDDGGSYGVGVVARGSLSAETFYAVIGFGGDSFYLVRLVAGAETVLAIMSAMALNTTYTVEIDVAGDQIRGRVDGGAWTTVTDSTITSGGWGIVAYGSVTGGGRWFNNFGAVQVGGGTITATVDTTDANDALSAVADVAVAATVSATDADDALASVA
ncbi:MAG TPA: hypothetical protein PK954_11905, partial [Anaerolineales bacterium]|nr:hypothetical protein [Anaerolineales bacterium]